LTALTAIVFYLGAAAAPAVSQTPSPATGQANLQAPGDNVLLDVAVRDKHKKPVLDLQPDQISVTDNGAPVKLTNLRLVSGKQQNEPLMTLLFDRPAIEGNQNDLDNSLFGGSASSAQETCEGLRHAASKLLKSIPASATGFQFGVMDIWGRLQIQQEYTADRKAVMQAVSMAVQPGQYGAKVTANAVEQRMAQIAKTGQDPAGTAVNTRERALARSMYAALQTSSRISKDQHMSLSLACLLALVEAQQSLPGRKTIIYFPAPDQASIRSHGMRGYDSRARDAQRAIIGAANRAGVNIYVVRIEDLAASNQLASMLDSYNVLTAGVASPAMTSSQGTLSSIHQFSSMDGLKSIASSNGRGASSDGLDGLARQTGGDVLNAGESISSPVKELIRGLTTYYEASYVPPSGDQDGSFHATVVKPLRSGLKVSTRTGYLALPPNAGITEAPQPFELPLMALLKRTELPGDLNYRAAVLRIGHLDEGSLSLVALEAPVSGLQIREDSSTHLDLAHISVLADIKDSTGTVIERFSEDIARRWAAGSSAGAAPEVISFQRSFSAPPGSYVLETAILDNNSGKTAAKRQTFEISSSEALPELSDLVVVRGMAPGEVEGSEPDPLRYGDQRVQPNLDGQIAAGVHQVSVFLLARPDPKSLEPATVKLEVLRDGVPLKGAPLTATLKAGAEFYPVLNSFSISSAADGQYQVRATLTQGGKSAETIGEFTFAGEGEHGTTGGPGEAPLVVDPPGLAAAEQTVGRPGPEELDRILADVRRNAMDYGNALPNLICQQITTRSVDARGDGKWKHKDTIVEVLTYIDHEESRTGVGAEENHSKKDAKDEIDKGMISAGEFGEALGGIFKPASKAEFTWKETGTLRGEAVEVFDYRIEQANSSFWLRALSGSAIVGYHGRIYVDRATHDVKSFTMISNDVPKSFPIRRAAVRVDYDYVAINDHDYLLPVNAQVVVGQSGNVLERNDLEFSKFRRFGSTLRILDSKPLDGPQ
jgi:VWFA-related protein